MILFHLWVKVIKIYEILFGIKKSYSVDDAGETLCSFCPDYEMTGNLSVKVIFWADVFGSLIPRRYLGTLFIIEMNEEQKRFVPFC